MSSPSPENIASPPTPVIVSTVDVPATLVKSPTVLGVSENNNSGEIKFLFKWDGLSRDRVSIEAVFNKF